jgi:hypothetical protein
MDYGSGLWWHLGGSLLTGAPVARLSFAATGADAPQLLGGLMKEEVGGVGHESCLARPLIPWLGSKGKSNVALYEVFILRVFKEMGPDSTGDAVPPGNPVGMAARGSASKPSDCLPDSIVPSAIP